VAILWITGSLLLLVLILPAIVLAIPVALGLTGAGSLSDLHGEIVWFFGAIRFPVTGKRSAKDTKEPGKKNKKKPDTSGPGPFRGLDAADITGTVRMGLTLLQRTVRRCTVTVDGELHIGLDDPADTGILWGEGYSFLQWISASTGLRAYPRFDGPIFLFRGRASLRVVPLALLIPVLQAAFSREGRKLLRKKNHEVTPD
jgi:hypothetical protein